MFVEIGKKPMPKGTRLSVNETHQFRRLIAENSYRKIFSNTKDLEIPKLRPRIVDAVQLKKEQEEINNWHIWNSEMEKEYIVSNRNT